MAPVIFLPHPLHLSPYGSALQEKPSNLVLQQSHQQYFKRSISNLLYSHSMTNTEDGVPLRDTSNKPFTTETKCVKAKSLSISPWTKYKSAASPSRRQQADKSSSSFEEILDTTHKTEREVRASLSKLRRMILTEGLPEE
ncbi:603_t:CDS:1, partial [Acaulospora colombiana]